MPDFIFVHVPRTGGNSINQALRWAGVEGLERPGSHLPIWRREGYRTKRSFGFVRNPFSRLVSLFMFTSPRRAAWDRRELLDRFRKFIAFRCTGDSPVPAAWELLSEDGVLAVDRVGRFENLLADFDDICDWLGVSRTTLPHLNRIPFPIDDYRAFYDTDTRDTVLRRHGKDFEMFGYSETI